MAKYRTRQRNTLLAFLSEHADEVLCAKQISSLIEGDSISVSAVYRNLAALEDEGLVKRVSKTGSREVFFQYIGLPQCRECLHLSCKECGKTFHMHANGAEMLLKSVAEGEGFRVDTSETVLYGICGDCQKIRREGA